MHSNAGGDGNSSSVGAEEAIIHFFDCGGRVLLSLDEPRGVRVGAVLGLKATINPMMVTQRDWQWGGDRGGER